MAQVAQWMVNTPLAETCLRSAAIAVVLVQCTPLLDWRYTALDSRGLILME